MATFNIGKKYSATHSYRKVGAGYECPGQIWKGNDPTGIRFVGKGRTLQAAVNDAIRKAKEVCPRT